MQVVDWFLQLCDNGCREREGGGAQGGTKKIRRPTYLHVPSVGCSETVIFLGRNHFSNYVKGKLISVVVIICKKACNSIDNIGNLRLMGWENERSSESQKEYDAGANTSPATSNQTYLFHKCFTRPGMPTLTFTNSICTLVEVEYTGMGSRLRRKNNT